MKYTVDLDNKTVEIVYKHGEEPSNPFIDKVMTRLSSQGFEVSVIEEPMVYNGSYTLTTNTTQWEANKIVWVDEYQNTKEYNLDNMYTNQVNIDTLTTTTNDNSIRLDNFNIEVDRLTQEVRELKNQK